LIGDFVVFLTGDFGLEVVSTFFSGSAIALILLSTFFTEATFFSYALISRFLATTLAGLFGLVVALAGLFGLTIEVPTIVKSGLD